MLAWLFYNLKLLSMNKLVTHADTQFDHQSPSPVCVSDINDSGKQTYLGWNTAGQLIGIVLDVNTCSDGI